MSPRIQQAPPVESPPAETFVTALRPAGNLTDATFEPLVEALMETLGGRFSLGWTHYVTLLTVTNSEARRFYEIEATSNGWGTRELERQIASSLYERLALSRDKEEIRKLAEQGLVVAQAADIIKNPYVLEFLDLQEHSAYSERELETAIIGKLEQFLLELGKGFLFEARQKRFTFDNDHFYVDLVFYNRLLRCYVLLDLKLDKLTHQDLGQMQMYVNYFDRHVKTAEEAPTIGILLCRRKSDALVELTLPEGREHSRVRIPALPTLERGTTEKTHGLDQGVGNMTDRRLIEDSLPLAEISEQSAREKSIRQGNISGIHLWWARRPLPACRAAVFAALVPAPKSSGERDSQHSLLRDISNWDHLDSNHPSHSAFSDAYRRLRSWSETAPRVLDPFSGGGAIPLEAARLGCAAYANDLNPVAHVVEFATLKAPQLLFRNAAELPSKAGRGEDLFEKTRKSA
jgi:predicted nuclease of restriction endonuclease-like (RecB) superfamily